jgi:hypothetical protein
MATMVRLQPGQITLGVFSAGSGFAMVPSFLPDQQINHRGNACLCATRQNRPPRNSKSSSQTQSMFVR